MIKIPRIVAANRTIRNNQPSSPPIVPESKVAIKLCQDPSINPIPSLPSGLSEIPKIRINKPNNKTVNNDINANHLITLVGPLDIVCSNL